jgi:MFS family permease
VLGVLAAGYFLMASVGSIVSTPICRMTGENYPLILTGMRVILGGLLFALALQGSILAFALFYLLLYFMIGTAGSPHAALYNDQIPSKQRATMMSFESLIFMGGGLIGSLLIGFVADIWSIPTAWMLAGVILAASSLAYLYLALNAKRLNLLACPEPGKVSSGDDISQSSEKTN